MIQKASYLLPGIVKYESSFPSHIDINAKQAHQNNRNHTGSPKGVWGQAQIAFTTSWFMAAFYFLLYLQEYVLSPVPFAISEVVPANRGGEQWMQKVVFLLSWQWEGTGPWPGWGPTIASAWMPHLGAFTTLGETSRRFCRWDTRAPSRGARKMLRHPPQQLLAPDLHWHEAPLAPCRWLLIGIGLTWQCPTPPPSLAAGSLVSLGTLWPGHLWTEKTMLIIRGGHKCGESM